MSLLSAAAADEDGDTINELRAENAQLRASLLAMHDTLKMTIRAGSAHARAAEGLRATVLAWALRAEEAEDMLEAIGAGGVGPLMPSDHCEQHLDMVPSAPQPPVVEQPQVEQKPVAWIEHEWSGSGLRHLHFERPAPTVRDEVVRPVWTPLYLHPQPKREPRTDREIVDQTEKLAELFMDLFQNRVKDDSSTTFRNSQDVRARFCWKVACRVQEMLTDTDPENAASELENGIGGEA